MKLHPDSVSAIEHIRTQSQSVRRLVFVSGLFNIIHPGHLRLLRFASECGDYLVVGVLCDISESSLLPEQLRLEGLQSNSWVKYAFVLRDSPADFIAAVQPVAVIKGKEHEALFNPEKEVVEKYGGKLLFGSGDITYSSVDLLREEFKKFNISTIVTPKEFPQRHDFTLDKIRKLISEINKLRVCVVGDIIVDEYIECDPLGMSQEDPTIVVTPILEQKFVGGAGIVTAHAAGLGAKAYLYSVVGSDEIAAFAKQSVKNHNVKTNLHEDESRPTTLKQRFRANEKTLLRVSHLRQHEISDDLQDTILEDILKVLNDIDMLVFSDFNYGCLPQKLVNSIIKECQLRNILMVADSQCSSQIGDVSRFKGMTLLTPTEREARLSVRDFDSGLVVLAEKLRIQAESQNVVMTLGAEGVLIHANISAENTLLTDRLSAFNSVPKDVAGAGDSMLICTAMGLTLGYDIWVSTFFGSLAAASQVSRLGNIPLSPVELLNEVAANSSL